MKRLRTRLVWVYLAATLPPLAATLWIANSLLDESLRYSSVKQLDSLSRTLEETGVQLYQTQRDALRRDADAGAAKPAVYGVVDRKAWPGELADFWDSNEPERFTLSGKGGSVLLYLKRSDDGVLAYRRDLGIEMGSVRNEHAQARKRVAEASARDLRRGVRYSFLLLAGLPWLAALGLLLWSADRVSRPITQLTQALQQVGDGKLGVRLPERRHGEVGAAMLAFNRMVVEMERNRDRLLYLARLESWQALARKTAHEIKNSLTPIRLTMEELAARAGDYDAFEHQAAQIVVDEVNRLERRVRAFSELGAEPPVHLKELDAGALIEERVRFLQSAHPEVDYRLDAAAAPVLADEDLLKVVLTNLLENAAEAAGSHGHVLARTARVNGDIAVEVHDSGPGISSPAGETLFEPTISFKKGGMGLGLSIARKSALLCGGDIVLVKGELGGAGFRVLLKPACPHGAS